MIRVAIISDTHGDFRNVHRAQEHLGPVDWLIHAGDYFRDAEVVAATLNVPAERVVAVTGNCDHPLREPAHEIVEIGGLRIWVTHGHHFGVKSSLDRIYFRAQELGVRAAIFGHSHVPVCADHGGLLLLNPGSLSLPRLAADPPTCARLDITSGDLTAQIIALAG